MSAIKSGEQNIAKGDAPQEHPERKGQLGSDWEKTNQGDARKPPGDSREKATPDKIAPEKTPDSNIYSATRETLSSPLARTI